MAQTKFNCPNCRRLVSVSAEYCPHCGNEVNFNTSNQKKNTSPNNTTKPSAPAPNIKKMEYEELPDITEEKEDFLEEEINISTPPVSNQTETYSEAFSEQEDEPEIPYNDENSYNNNESLSMANLNNDKRTPISWSDTEKKENVDISKAYINNKYEANYDGYYNDVLPKIQDEVDSLLKGKEKTILKIIFSIIGICGIIVYLVLTI